MNPIINSLSLIADAAEYMDRSTSAAWRIRTALSNMAVWQANSLLYAMEQDDGQRLHREQIKMATVRCWIRDCNSSSFVLDLTQPAIRKTLGLDRQSDPHEEACRVARGKCLQTRSATRFAEYYKQAILVAEERKRQRESRVGDIENILADHGFVLDGQLFDSRGYDTMYEEQFVRDEDLYDDDTMEVELDKLSETLGNALESMHNECERQLNSAVTTQKINRLMGYKSAIVEMMKVVGVDTQKLAERAVKLEAQIDSAASIEKSKLVDIDAQIADQLATMQHTPEPAQESKPKRASLDYETRMREAREAKQARTTEDAEHAKRAAASKKAAATRAARAQAAA